MKSRQRTRRLFWVLFAIAMFIVAAVVNPINVGRWIAPDGVLESHFAWGCVIAFESVLGCAGLLVLLRPPSLGDLFSPAVGLVLFGLSFGVVIGEIGVRVWLSFFAPADARLTYALYTDLPPTSFRFVSHPYLAYALTPNYRHGETTHNSIGFREHEIQLPKPSGTFRIVCLGGSTTYTVGVDDNQQAYPKQLEQALRNTYGYRHVEVINAGVGGYNSWEYLMHYLFRIRELSPDLVILYEGINDVYPRLVIPDSFRGDNSARRKAWEAPKIRLLEHSALIRVVLRKLGFWSQVSVEDFVDAPTYVGRQWYRSRSDSEFFALLSTNSTSYFERNLKTLVREVRSDGAAVVFATFSYTAEFHDALSVPYIQRAIDDSRQVMDSLGAELTVPVYHFERDMPTEIGLWVDGMHQNAAGAKIMGERFAAFLDSQRIIPGTPTSQAR